MCFIVGRAKVVVMVHLAFENDRTNAREALVCFIVMAGYIYCLLELNMLCDCVTRGCGDHSPLDGWIVWPATSWDAAAPNVCATAKEGCCNAALLPYASQQPSEAVL